MPATHRMINGQQVALTPEEATAVEGEWQAWLDAASARVTQAIADARTQAVALLDDPQPSNKALRAVLLAVLTEINALRERDRDRSADVAAATSLANLQTRWAARVTLVDRTVAQAKVVARARINGGEAD